MGETDQTLSKAFELIEAERFNDARAVLEPALKEDNDNVDAWWLYAHAVEDPQTAHTALSNVLRLDSSYPGADQLMAKLDKELTVQIGTAPDRKGRGLDLELDDFELEEEGAGGSGHRRFLLRFGLVAATVIVIALAVVLLSMSGGEGGKDNTSEPQVTATTQVVSVGTAIPTGEGPVISPTTVMSNPTESQTIQTVIQVVPPSLIEALGDLMLANDNFEMRETDLGTTLLVSICSTSGEMLRATLERAMPIISGEISSFSSDVEALGIILVDCSTNATLNVIAVARGDALDLLDGTITDTEFRSRWRAVG